MRHGVVQWSSGVAILASVLGLACGETTSPPTPGAYRFQSSATGSTLVVQVAAAAMRDTAETLRRSHTERWVVGAIRRGDGGVNAPWSWHLDPTTIAFPEATIEACQATPEYTEQTLEYWITFGQVCILGFVTAPLE